MPASDVAEPTVDPADDIAAEQVLAAVDARVRAADSKLRDLVAERPLLALGVAIAGGFLIGRLLSR